MGKTSSTVKNRYNAKAYDQIPVRVPKGRKRDIEAYAKANNQSVNGMINTYLRTAIGMSEEEWKHSEDG